MYGLSRFLNCSDATCVVLREMFVGGVLLTLAACQSTSEIKANQNTASVAKLVAQEAPRPTTVDSRSIPLDQNDGRTQIISGYVERIDLGPAEHSRLTAIAIAPLAQLFFLHQDDSHYAESLSRIQAARNQQVVVELTVLAYSGRILHVSVAQRGLY